MTWAEFKAEVERQGVKDDDPIADIDNVGSFPIECRREYDGWSIIMADMD